MGPTCFCTACYLSAQIRRGVVSRHAISFRKSIAIIGLSMPVSFSSRWRFRCVVVPSLSTLPRLCGAIFVPVSTNCRYLTSILVCFFTNFYFSDLTSAATWVTNLWLSMTAFKDRLINSGQHTTFCTVWSTKISKAAHTRLLTPFGLAVGVSSNHMFNVSSPCTLMLDTTPETRSCLLVWGATGAVLILVGRSSEAI